MHIYRQCHAAVRLLCEPLPSMDRNVAEAILAPLLHHLPGVGGEHQSRGKRAQRAAEEAQVGPKEPTPPHPSAGLVVEEQEEQKQEEQEQEEEGQQEQKQEGQEQEEEEEGMEEDLPNMQGSTALR